MRYTAVVDRKPVVWLGGARRILRRFPNAARQRAGYELYRTQIGLDPTAWKPLSQIGFGVREIRVRTNGAFRVIYVAQYPEAIYVLHAFEKRSSKARAADLGQARMAMRTLLAMRERKETT